ncbi:MAG: hypothetical protein AABW90_00170 [Nanoarchaeota archaeon]
MKKRGSSHFDFAINNILPKSKSLNSFLYLDVLKKILPKYKNSNSSFKSDSVKILPDSKLSQTTIFIILAILIAGTISGVVYFQQTKNQKFFELSENKAKLDNAKNLVGVCIEDSISNSLDAVGFQGGYYEKPKYHYQDETFDNFLTYYYYQGQILNPSKIIVEKELEKAVNAELDNCKNIEGKDFKLEFRNPRTKVFIKEKELLFDIYFPVTIDIDGKSTALFRDYQINRISGLNDILETANFMTESRKESPELDCISCLAEITEEKNLYIEIYNFDETTTLVGIYENYTLDQQTLMFLNKF